MTVDMWRQKEGIEVCRDGEALGAKFYSGEVDSKIEVKLDCA